MAEPIEHRAQIPPFFGGSPGAQEAQFKNRQTYASLDGALPSPGRARECNGGQYVVPSSPSVALHQKGRGTGCQLQLLPDLLT